MTEEKEGWFPKKGDTGWYVRVESGYKLAEAVCTEVTKYGIPKWRQKEAYTLVTYASPTPVEAYTYWLRGALARIQDYQDLIGNILIDIDYAIKQIKLVSKELEEYANLPSNS